MSTYAIYAFVVTGLYIVYMAIAIMMDLFGKKGQKKDNSEFFNNSDIGDDVQEEQSTVVDETDDGYAVHHPGDYPEIPTDDEQEEMQMVDPDEDPDTVDQSEQPVDANPDDEDLLEQESKESMAEYESLKAVQANMDTVQPFYQEEYNSNEFAVIMAQPIDSQSHILRKIVNI